MLVRKGWRGEIVTVTPIALSTDVPNVVLVMLDGRVLAIHTSNIIGD